MNYYYEIISDNGRTRNLTRITHHGSTTNVRNDLWGNRLYLGDPDAGISTFVYNKFNELISETDANNNTITYQYDQLGRVTSKGYTEDGSAKSITYLYDTYTTANRGKGQLSSVKINNVLSESYTYDALGRLSQESKIIDGQTYTQGYTYNSDGLTDVISYPDNFAVKYAYDANGDLASIRRNDNSSLIYNVSKRNMLGQVTRSYVGNDIATTYTYDNYGSVTWLSTGNKVYIEEPPVIIHTTENIDINFEELESDSACTEMNMPLASDPIPYERSYVTDNAVQYLGYSYNPQGLMLSRKDLKHSQCEYFTYDNLDRLTSHTLGACSGGYTPQYYNYSSAGNILSSPVLGDYTYGSGNDKPHAVNHIELSQNHADAISASNCCVTYNAFNRPIYIEEGAQRLTLLYDANRQRNKTTLSNTSTMIKTKYFASDFYEKEVIAGEIRELNYIYANNKLIAIFAVDNTNPGGKMYYIHTDHVGSYDVITTDNKVVTERYHFDPWGNRKNPTNWAAIDTRTSFFFDRGFTGHEHLDAFKIINMNARLYDPVISRFFSPDPYVQAPESSQGFNRYSYCANNPLKYVDPSGELFDWVERRDGSIYWDENAISQETTKQGEKYLGKNVLVGTHNRDANLNEPINSARFDLYLESYKEGISATIYGNTVPADVKLYGTLAEGLYPATSGSRTKYPNENALIINHRRDLPTVTGENPNNPNSNMLSGIFFHVGNTSRESLSTLSETPISMGCMTSHNGKEANAKHNQFMSVVGTNFNGSFYLRSSQRNKLIPYNLNSQGIPRYYKPVF